MKKYYNGEHIVACDNINGESVQIYVVFKDGKIYLEKFVDFVIDRFTLIADVSKELEK